MNPINLVQWVHIISGVAWLGEVITINIVLVPALLKMSPDTRRTFIRQVFRAFSIWLPCSHLPHWFPGRQ